MLSTALTNLNHSDTSESSNNSSCERLMKVEQLNDLIKSSVSVKSASTSKLFSIDSILKPNNNSKGESSDEAEDGEDMSKKSLNASSTSKGSTDTPVRYNLPQTESDTLQQQQKAIYDQFLLNNIQNSLLKNCFQNPQMLLNNLNNQNQLQDLIIPSSMQGLGQNLAHLSQAAALANNYFFQKNSTNQQQSSLCNSTPSLSSSSSSLSSSSDLSSKLSPSLSPVTGHINNNNINYNRTSSSASSTSQNHQKEAMNSKLNNMLSQQQSTDLKNFFSNMPNANQFQRMNDLTSNFVQNSPFSNFNNPFLNMNSNNGELNFIFLNLYFSRTSGNSGLP